MSKKSKTDPGRRPDPYAIDKLATIPTIVKVGFLKFWVYGAVFYFVVFGLGGTLKYLDLLAVEFLVLVLVIEYIANTLILWMDTDERPSKQYLPHEIKRKSVLSLFMTAVYTAVVFGLSNLGLYVWVDVAGLPTFGDLMSQSTADPITFSLMFLLFDFLWITVRRGIKRVLQKKG